VRASSAGAGAGARFEVRLPLQPAAESEPRRDKPAVKNLACRVLIVEDGLDTRETLGMLVRQWRHDVLFASNGPEGLARAKESRPDVMLIDIGLPGFDGYQLARKLRNEGTDWSRRVRLIALTGYGQAADRERAAEAGFDLHLLKPVDPVYLQRLLGEEVTATS
jgi:CheY-like chemotaxis protein